MGGVDVGHCRATKQALQNAKTEALFVLLQLERFKSMAMAIFILRRSSSCLEVFRWIWISGENK